jgi:DNA (cytosine-5)-methyltransferase 1
VSSFYARFQRPLASGSKECSPAQPRTRPRNLDEAGPHGRSTGTAAIVTFCWMSSGLSVKPSPATRPVAIDLFSGAGGLSLGLEQAGFELAAALERAEGPATTHRLNFPNTPLLRRDIRWLRPADVRGAIHDGFAAQGFRWSGEVALTAGGPPCQGYSTGGTKRTDDERNALVHEFRRIVVSLDSRYFLMENVPGLLFKPHARALAKLRADFVRAGYEVAEPLIVDASSLGLPQIRRRVLLVGWKRGEIPVDVATIQRIQRRRVTVQEAIGDLPRIEEVDALREVDTYVLPIRGQERSAYAKAMRALVVGQSHLRFWDGRSLSGCAQTIHSGEVVARFRRTRAGETEPTSRYRRLKADGVASTIRAGTGPEHGSHTSPRPIHFRAPRVITVREAARLQSFPDWFQFAPTKWHAWQEIGNAVPPILARVAGEAIMRALGSRPTEDGPISDLERQETRRTRRLKQGSMAVDA